MPDRVERLLQAAQARHDATLARATQSLLALARNSQPITVRRLAREAGVSRSWIYRQADLRREIDQLRQSSARIRPSAQVAQRASTDSLRQQLHIYREELGRLRNENRRLTDQLARQLGAARAASVTKPT